MGDDSAILRDSLIDQIDEGICNSFQGGNANPLAEIDNLASELVIVLNELQEFAKAEVIDIKETFGSDLESRVNAVEDTTDYYESVLNPAYYASPAIVFGFIFMIGIILAWVNIKFGIYFCIQTWVILPLFFIFFTVSIIAIAAVGIALVGNAGEVFLINLMHNLQQCSLVLTCLSLQHYHRCLYWKRTGISRGFHGHHFKTIS